MQDYRKLRQYFRTVGRGRREKFLKEGKGEATIHKKKDARRTSEEKHKEVETSEVRLQGHAVCGKGNRLAATT